MVLRVLRVLLIVAGIGVAAFGMIMIAVESDISGSTINVNWQCEPSSSTSGGQDCHTRGGNYGGPNGFVDLIGWASLPVGGVVLVGAAIAIGQFERPRQSAPNAARPMAPAAAGPPPYGPGTPPQGNRPPGAPPGWTGQQQPPH